MSTLESRAARLAEKSLEFNELDFVSWKEFRRMAPAVVGLEIARLERLMGEYEPASDEYNGLVRARFEMRQFADGISAADKSSLDECAEHLRRALLVVSLLAADVDSESLRYVVQRLTYVYDRVKLIY